MKITKKTKKVIFILILIFFVYVFFIINFNLNEKEILISKMKNIPWFNSITNYEILSCKNEIDSKYSFIYEDVNSDILGLHIRFYNLNYSGFGLSDGDMEYIGGTTIRNTTFPMLIKMVKEDCSQFKKIKPKEKEGEINWTYKAYDKYQEDLKSQARLEKERKIFKDFRQEALDNGYTEKEWRKNMLENGVDLEKYGL